jgi:hypothetical protein
MPQTAATTTTIAPLDAAYARFLEVVGHNRPRRLDALNRPSDLSGRACDIDAQFRACQGWLTALVEDSAPHFGVRAADLVRLISQMEDIASDVRGPLVDAVHTVVVAA